jgi:hypothetical protein
MEGGWPAECLFSVTRSDAVHHFVQILLSCCSRSFGHSLPCWDIMLVSSWLDTFFLEVVCENWSEVVRSWGRDDGLDAICLCTVPGGGVMALEVRPEGS